MSILIRITRAFLILLPIKSINPETVTEKKLAAPLRNDQKDIWC
jgi:hypothetical protein